MKRVWVKGSQGWLRFFPWVFKKHFRRAEPDVEAGDYCAVYHEKAGLMGSAIYNPNSNIVLRFYSREEEPLDYSVLKRLIERAWSFRKSHMGDEKAYRVVFGESDSLPGLVVDKYDDGVVFQIHCLGMERRRHDIVNVLLVLFAPQFLFEKSETHARLEEGLEPRVELVEGELPEPMVLPQAGIHYKIDLWKGQKTGFFLDQRKNRLRVEHYAKGKKRGLDLFSYTGGFTLHMLRAGVEKVYAVERSGEALNMLLENLDLNGLDRDRVLTFEKDVFEFLDEMILSTDTFDIIVIDPPAFAKGKKALENALKGYKVLHDRALRLIEPGGIIVTFTCAQIISRENLLGTVEWAAQRLQRRLYILESLGQPEDHPILVGFPQSNYLKGFIFEVL
jgi:23S rRNA (cytosine1962-C5)-methyltransferase